MRLLVLLGYGLVLLLLLGGLLLIAAGGVGLWLGDGEAFVFFIMLIGMGLSMSWNVLVGLFYRFPMPEGVRIDRQLAPELVREVDEVCRTLGASRPHAIVLSGDLNAALYTLPRLGILGWNRTVLVLGWPVLRLFDLEEVRGIIAHELGHQIGDHGSGTDRLLRLRLIWIRLYERAMERGQGNLTARFLRWYVPKFDRATFEIAREQEIEADEASARIVGGDVASRALCRVEVLSREAAEHVHPDLELLPATMAEPPDDLVERLVAQLTQQPASAERWLREALARPTTDADTHPALSERITSMGQSPAVQQAPAPTRRAAAHSLLGEGNEAFGRQLSSALQQSIADGWRERHEYLQQAAKRRDELLATAEPTEQTALELVQLQLELLGDRSALPMVEAFAAEYPDNPLAQFLLGQLYFNRDDPRCVTHLKRAMELDAEATVTCARLLEEWHLRHGEADHALNQRLLAEQRGKLEEAAQLERAKAPRKRRLGKPKLSDTERERIIAAAREQEHIAAVHVAAVDVTHMPEIPHHAIAIKMARSWFVPQSDKKDIPVLEAFNAKLDITGSWHLVTDNEAGTRVAAAVRKKGERVYGKKADGG